VTPKIGELVERIQAPEEELEVELAAKRVQPD